MRGDSVEELRRYLKNQFEGAEVIEGDFEVCAAEICQEFGGCAGCQGLMVARGINDEGEEVRPTRLFICTHWCHVKGPPQ